MQALSLVSFPPPQDLEQELHEPHSAHYNPGVEILLAQLCVREPVKNYLADFVC